MLLMISPVHFNLNVHLCDEQLLKCGLGLVQTPLMRCSTCVSVAVWGSELLTKASCHMCYILDLGGEGHENNCKRA